MKNIKPKKIFSRIIVKEIKKYLFADDIIVLHGARQVGKTSILNLLQNYLKEKKCPVYYIDLEDSRFVKILDSGVNEFIKHLEEEGYKATLEKKRLFVFIDEIQYLSNPSQFLKLIADHHKNIKLIVSGSSSFDIKNKFKDSLVGITVNFEIFNLSFEEFLIFKNYYWNHKIKNVTEKKQNELREFFKEYVLYGGYPKIVLTPESEQKEKYLQQIIDTYIKKDIRDLADIKDITKFNKLLEVLSSQSGQLLNVAELANTCNIASQTVEKYLFILENIYIIKLVKPFHQNIRSELFKTPKIFFYDSGLAQMLWLKELQKEILGNIFETAIFSELVKKHGKDNIFYWRTKDKKEIDFILRIKNQIIPIEVKLHFTRFNPTAINYFNEKYKVKKLYCAVYNKKDDKTNKKIEQLYPWEIDDVKF
ncbi:ATP-binding protein [Patescibacteria group bacterium]|nr:ATP-binding protein [Patescibacteria group bacterium]MBU1730608.1 ATP-binding protein [Patescibacteria group bacterium]MBU1956074.1 ATP-binding protein [Patescibacteria group bacterium]